MKISPIAAACVIGITLKPCIRASNALVGSISVTTTSAPNPFARSATPLPQYPKPATTTTFPATKVLVARKIASNVDCPVPYRLSNMCFVSVSFTAIIGNFKAPSFAIWLNLITPVVVSSQPASTPSINSVLDVCITFTKSQPSSNTNCGLISNAELIC